RAQKVPGLLLAEDQRLVAKAELRRPNPGPCPSVRPPHDASPPHALAFLQVRRVQAIQRAPLEEPEHHQEGSAQGIAQVFQRQGTYLLHRPELDAVRAPPLSAVRRVSADEKGRATGLRAPS